MAPLGMVTPQHSRTAHAAPRTGIYTGRGVARAIGATDQRVERSYMIGVDYIRCADQAMSFDLVLFGGTGDLAWRKLMPALFQAFRHGTLPDGGRIIGVARDDLQRRRSTAS